MVKGYCVRCKKMQEIKDGKETTTKNKRKMMKGKCPKCDTTICKFIKK